MSSRFESLQQTYENKIKFMSTQITELLNQVDLLSPLFTLVADLPTSGEVSVMTYLMEKIENKYIDDLQSRISKQYKFKHLYLYLKLSELQVDI